MPDPSEPVAGLLSDHVLPAGPCGAKGSVFWLCRCRAGSCPSLLTALGWMPSAPGDLSGPQASSLIAFTCLLLRVTESCDAVGDRRCRRGWSELSLCRASSLVVPVLRVMSPFIVMISFPPVLYPSSVPPQISFGPGCASAPRRQPEPQNE